MQINSSRFSVNWRDWQMLNDVMLNWWAERFLTSDFFFLLIENYGAMARKTKASKLNSIFSTVLETNDDHPALGIRNMLFYFTLCSLTFGFCRAEAWRNFFLPFSSTSSWGLVNSLLLAFIMLLCSWNAKKKKRASNGRRNSFQQKHRTNKFSLGCAFALRDCWSCMHSALLFWLEEKVSIVLVSLKQWQLWA